MLTNSFLGFVFAFTLLFVLVHTTAIAQQKRLYIAIDDHTDYMWTADEATYDSAFVRMLDFYLEKIDSTRHLPPDQQARFNTDGSIWLRAYERLRSPQQFQKLVAAIRSGHISSPLHMLVNCYGAQPTEAVLRGMYHAGSLQRKYGLNFTMAGAMENNTLPLGLASLWAGSGAKYSWKGIGGYGSQMSYEMRATRRYPMYQYRGLDGSGVLMKWYAYNEKTIAPLGGYAECRLHIKYIDLKADLKGVINTLHRYSDSIGYNVAGAFGFGHDDLETLVAGPFVAATREATNANRRVRLSNEEDFFKDFEKTYPKLPSQSVSYGNEWDLLSASMNETTARVRRATEGLRTAEALAALATLRDPNFMKGLEPMRAKAWEAFGVYWEHNWTADGPVSRKKRADWQIAMQQQISRYVDTLRQLGAADLGRNIRQREVGSFYVFNPLSWARTDVADMMFEKEEAVHVIDASTGKAVHSQWIQKEGKHFLRILAENIPSVGYKVFEIRSGAPGQQQAAASFDNGYFSNRFYRLKLSCSGAVTELFDKLANRQLVKEAGGKFVNDLGATDKASGEEVVVENSGQVSVTLKAVSNNPLRHTVRLTLFRNSPRIDIEDSIQGNFGDVKTWSFAFNLAKPTTRHEETGAVLTVKKRSRGGHYADENARYDYQTFNHFADLSEKDYGVTLSNLDCSFFRLGASTVDSLHEEAPVLHALAGGNVDKKVEDGGILGILNQNGQKDFRYQFSLTTHQKGFDAAAAMRFSLEHQNPLVAGWVKGNEKASSATSYSLLQIANPDVFCWSIKPAEEGVAKGLIARLWNQSGAPASATVRLNGGMQKAWKTTHLEIDEKVMKPSVSGLNIKLKRFGIATYRLVPGRVK